MLNTGFLVALLPEWKTIVNRIQYDAYHVHPVDKHSLLAVRILKTLVESTSEGDNSLYPQLFADLARPELVLWAALFHDIGKGVPEEDHAEEGAEIVRRVFARMGFSATDVDTISFLVREHLAMVQTATQRDLQDEKIVVEFARKVGDVDPLKMLYLLTVADCMATGPKAWNSWTDVLLKELFFKVHQILQRGELATRTSAEIVAKKREEVFQKVYSVPREKLAALFENMSPRYLLYTPLKDMVRHIELVQMLGDAPFVLEPCTRTGAYFRTVTVCAKDRPGLFSSIAGVLTLNNLDILNANIYTWGNEIGLDLFTVRGPRDSIHEDEVWSKVRNDLHAVLAGAWNLESALDEKLLSRRPTAKTDATQQDKIVVDNEQSAFFTIIEVHTHDFPGLLYRITNTLFRCGLDVRIAKIATKVDQVMDIFYVRDTDGQKVVDREIVADIRSAIGQVLSKGLDAS
jgi:[protein-PII] uridylyltransferase